MSVILIVYFNIVEFHHVDWVKLQLGGEHPVPRDSVNVGRFSTTTGRGKDVW
ncbi:uncharacterized protein DS421_1g30190 [Arachis hypogaea]|nr:uncharacterized protein DS421_1g30190 [Arachis hypogaea]